MSNARLVLVGTPIGNLADLSPRAVEALAQADVVACEDTRHSGRLLKAVGVMARELLSLNDHNENQRVPQIIERLARGQVVALVSDAGMPGISDPGERLVAAVSEAGYRIETVPGPTALISALVVSGLPISRFVYEGFLPRKGKARSARLAALSQEERTIVMYESPHRLARTVADLAEWFGETRRISISRELTKLYEETWRGTLGEAIVHTTVVVPRGEYVLVVEGAPEAKPASLGEVDAALAFYVDQGLSKRDATDRVARELGVSRRDVYNRALML